MELGGVAEGQELPIEVQHRMIERSDKEEDDVSMHIEPSHQLESHPTDAVFSGEGKKFKKSKLKGIDRDGNIISE
ncbi:MAG: hypothetical protein HW383_650 [Candidatus Magasanikbacteria bacterium]|nr:hypothetical protein [Candidatus Magasanikbacteria bacterium]